MSWGITSRSARKESENHNALSFRLKNREEGTSSEGKGKGLTGIFVCLYYIVRLFVMSTCIPNTF
jgi:hypothetical protein